MSDFMFKHSIPKDKCDLSGIYIINMGETLAATDVSADYNWPAGQLGSQQCWPAGKETPGDVHTHTS